MFHLIEPYLGRISGGLRYNKALVDAAGGRLQRHVLPAGGWPEPTREDVAGLQRLVDGLDGAVLVDGLVGCGLAHPLETGVPVVQLVHALATTKKARTRQKACLQAADAVVATSRFSAKTMHQHYGVYAVAAPPGVQPRPLAQGGAGGRLICVGAVAPNKHQLFVANVLKLLHNRHIDGWECTFAGPVTDQDYAAQLRQVLAGLPQGSTHVVGELDDAGLTHLYANADLLLLASHTETFGLVVQEAAAAGIPALVSSGTGAQEALTAGAALPLVPKIWADTLQRWLTDQTYRHMLQATSREARKHLDYGWEHTASTVLGVLDEVSGAR